MNDQPTKLADLLDVLEGETVDVENIEILNQFQNSHNIKFTDKDFDEIIEVFNENKETFSPHLKLSHSDHQKILKEIFKLKDLEHGEEIPGLGFVKRLHKSGKKLLADFEKIPKVLHETLFSGKFFRSVSPEILRNFRDTGKMALRAVALLNNPSQKHIQDVHMGEALTFDGNFQFIDLEEKNMEPKQDDKPKDSSSKLSEKLDKLGEIVKGLVKPKASSDDPVKLQEQRINDLESKLEQATSLVEQQAKLISQGNSEVTKLQEKQATIQLNARKAQADAICKKAIMDGVPPIVVETMKPLLFQEVSEQQLNFSEMVKDKESGEMIENKFDQSVSEVVQNMFDKFPNKIDFKEQTKTTLNQPGKDDEGDKILELAEKIKKANPEMTKFDALKQAGLEMGGV